MIDVKEFYSELKKQGVDFFCGVPDSLLKSFCAYVTANTSNGRNIITSNEGAAIALACGYYIGSGKISMVYMQNSGIGNATNPLISLSDPEVYSIPLLLLIGWRGEPGIKDEPQHIKQGKVTLDLLEAMKIPYLVLNSDSNIHEIVTHAIHHCKNSSSPFALVVRKGTFSDFKLESDELTEFPLTRESALEIVLNSIPKDSIIVSTTGMLSRELYELREKRGEKHCNDFLTVGSMGHTSQIALGIALANKTRKIFCFEGDGGALMHMGSYAILGNMHVENLNIILFNNGSHDSVGGQPTVGLQTNFQKIFEGCGFLKHEMASKESELRLKLKDLLSTADTFLFEIKIRKGSRKDLGRPAQTPLQTKNDVIRVLRGDENSDR